MKKLLPVVVAVLSILILGGSASADLIVDTGQPPDAALAGGVSIQVWRAGKFTINEPGYWISDIEGYFALFPDAGGNIIIDIREEDGGLPSSSVLYSGTFLLPASSSGTWTYGWYGLHGLSGWSLEPDDYWVVFRGDPGYTSDPSYLGGMTRPAPNPLSTYAVAKGGDWEPELGGDWGIRVSGAPVPEPATMLLLGSGLIGLAAFRRKFRKS